MSRVQLVFVPARSFAWSSASLTWQRVAKLGWLNKLLTWLATQTVSGTTHSCFCGSDGFRMGKNISSGCGKDSKDLGTEEDFKEAIRAVHEKGGRVILYVEPLIIDTDSDIARAWDQGLGS